MDDAPPGNARPSRRLRIALVVSLGLNLATAGLVGGLLLSGPPPPGPRGEVGLWSYGSALPEPFRGDLAQALRAGHSAWDGPRRGLRAQRAALADALVAEPYDPAAVARVLDGNRALLATLADGGTTLLLAQIERMDEDERRAYAEALRKRRGGPPGRDR